MPLTPKGEKILANMKEQYGSEEKAKEVLYASKNKGTITGIDAADAPLPVGAAFGYGVGDQTTRDGPNLTEAPVPKRRPDLLGTVSTPNGIKPAEVTSKDQGLMPTGGSTPAAGSSMSSTGVSASTTGSTSTGTMLDAKDEAVDLKGVQPPMNNLSSPGNPGRTTGPTIPYTGHQVGDSLHNQNVRNRAFWAKKGRR
jgi:hypothetical protein